MTISTSAEETKLSNAAAFTDQKLEQFQPMWKIVVSQFFEHRAAVVSFFVVSLFVIVALSAPLISWVTGLRDERQNALHRFAPLGSTVPVAEDVREERFNDYVAQYPGEVSPVAEELRKNNLTTLTDPSLDPKDVVKDLIMKDPDEALEDLSKIPAAPVAHLQKMVKDFNVYHWLGTDELGRDVFIRLVYGARVSMGVGVLVAVSSSLLGLLIGAIAGYYGGFIDVCLMRFTDSLLSLPLLPIQIVIAAIDMHKIPYLGEIFGAANQSMYKMVFILVLFSWMTVALLVRSSILSLREREFILASKTLGARDFSIIVRHMFPNVVAPMLVSVTLGIGESIITESVLSFLGLGIQQPTPSWGNMLNNAQDLMTEAPFLAIMPGLLILATTISFNYIGDGLQDAVDPKAIRR